MIKPKVDNQYSLTIDAKRKHSELARRLLKSIGVNIPVRLRGGFVEIGCRFDCIDVTTCKKIISILEDNLFRFIRIVGTDDEIEKSEVEIMSFSIYILYRLQKKQLHNDH